MIKIMFVCHGNICRSPMAEFVFRRIVRENGREKDFEASSSAATDEEISGGKGNPVYPPAERELKKHGIDCNGKHAVMLMPDDAERYDLFIGMDSENIHDMRRILGKTAENRIYRLMEFTPRGGDVSDPWYTGRFDEAYSDIEEGCRALFLKLK